MKKPYKTTFKYRQIECLKEVIEKVMQDDVVADDDRLLVSVLAKIHGRLYDKLKREFIDTTMSFEAYEAFALRILFNDYLMDFTTYIGAKLHLMSNDIHEHFNN